MIRTLVAMLLGFLVGFVVVTLAGSGQLGAAVVVFTLAVIFDLAYVIVRSVNRGR